MCRAGQRYRDIHFTATRMLAAGLVDLGLLRGAVDDLVESGASGVFFPHGVGHLIGLDVHDLENFGDRPAYAPGRSRPEQFGARYLRMDLDLEANMVVTIEPGLYFVPAIVHDRALRTRFADQVNYAEAERWLGLGGIRIEDDVRVRPASEAGGEPETLSADAPKTLDALEALIGSGPSAEERLSA
jgi:Xaa-Pro aminopeptidase